MPLKCGIVGLPNSGKSSLFNALTGAGARVDSFPFTTVDPNVGMVPVEDERLEALSRLVKVQKVTPAFIEFVDIAGLVKGAHKGEGLGNAFLSHIRGTDLIVHVVRCFRGDVPHVMGEPDPERDVETIELELILSDLELIERRLSKKRDLLKKGVKEAGEEIPLLEEAQAYLREGKFIPSHLASKLPKDLQLITALPVVFVANTAGEPEAKKWVSKVHEIAARRSTIAVEVNVKLESELQEMEPEERAEFMEAYGIKEPPLQLLVKASYRLLNLITFYTYAGGKELRAWPLPQGSTALNAAGKIHSDFEKFFVRAEVISFEDFISCGGEEGARQKGLVKIVGKDYQVQDGDIITFKISRSL